MSFSLLALVRRPKCFCVGLIVGLSLCTSAQASPTPGDQTWAVRIDGRPVYAYTIEALLQQGAAASKGKISRNDVLDSVIGNRLLAAAARKQFGDDVLYASSRVAFRPEVALDDKLVALLRALHGKQIEADIATLPGGTLNGLITEQPMLTAETLHKLYGSPGKLQLDYTLNPQQQEVAKQIVLLRFKEFDERRNSLTLYGVYLRQNVQGRMEFYNRNQAFIKQQTMLTLANRYVLSWTKTKLGVAVYEDLRRALSDRDDVDALTQLYGIGGDIDAESPVQNQLLKQVSQREIAVYYRQHKDEFRRIERVKARHIRVAEEALAMQILTELRKGQDFGKLARQHSIAADANGGGELGWIAHQPGLDWLAQLAYSQIVGQVSRPTRTPGEDAWEIVLVDQRVDGDQSADSETVRYAAGRAIARQRAARQFQSLRAQVMAAAKIEWHPQLPVKK